MSLPSPNPSPLEVNTSVTQTMADWWNRARGLQRFPGFGHQISAAIRTGLRRLSHPWTTLSREETRWAARQESSSRAANEATGVLPRTSPVGWVAPQIELTSVADRWRAGCEGREMLESAVSHLHNHRWVSCLLGGWLPASVASLDGKIHGGRKFPVLLYAASPSTGIPNPQGGGLVLVWSEAC